MQRFLAKASAWAQLFAILYLYLRWLSRATALPLDGPAAVLDLLQHHFLDVGPFALAWLVVPHVFLLLAVLVTYLRQRHSAITLLNAFVALACTIHLYGGGLPLPATPPSELFWLGPAPFWLLLLSQSMVCVMARTNMAVAQNAPPPVRYQPTYSRLVPVTVGGQSVRYVPSGFAPARYVPPQPFPQQVRYARPGPPPSTRRPPPHAQVVPPPPPAPLLRMRRRARHPAGPTDRTGAVVDLRR